MLCVCGAIKYTKTSEILSFGYWGVTPRSTDVTPLPVAHVSPALAPYWPPCYVIITTQIGQLLHESTGLFVVVCRTALLLRRPQ